MAEGKPRSPAQRSEDNWRFQAVRQAAGITQVNVAVPIERLAELRAVTLAWRKEAKLLLETDLPSADQILQIHATVRVLRLRLPVRAFDTKASAAQWLLDRQATLGERRAKLPRLRAER